MYLYKFFILKYVIIKIFTIFENISETISRNFLIFRNTQVTKIDQRLLIQKHFAKIIFLKFHLIGNCFTHGP